MAPDVMRMSDAVRFVLVLSGGLDFDVAEAGLGFDPDADADADSGVDAAVDANAGPDAADPGHIVAATSSRSLSEPRIVPYDNGMLSSRGPGSGAGTSAVSLFWA